jgi:hypothetical protein
MKNQQAGNQKRSQKAAETWNKRKAEIVWLYQSQMWSQARIAEYYGVTLAGIQKAMKRLAIPSHSHGRRGTLNGRYKDGSESTLYRLMIQKDKCAMCPATTGLVIHHRNFDHQDNHLENLQVLCLPCHSSLHKREWWRRRKLQL